MKPSIRRSLPLTLAATCLIALPASAAWVSHYPLEGNLEQSLPGGTPDASHFGTQVWVPGIAPGSSGAFQLGPGSGNGRIHVAANDIWRDTAGFSVSAWIQPLALAGEGHSATSIFWLGDQSSNSARFVLQLNDGGDLRAGGRRLGSEGNFTTDLVAGTNITGTTNNELDIDPITVGEVYHVAATADYSTGMVSIYLNGTLLIDRRIEAWAPYGPTTDDQDYIIRFGMNGSGSEVFNGYIDDVRIYDHVLSDSEVAALAVPEPSAALLGGLGMMGWAFGSRRRRGA